MAIFFYWFFDIFAFDFSPIYLIRDMKEQIISIEGLGQVTLKWSDKCSHISLRLVNGNLQLIIPESFSMKNVAAVLQNNLNKIQKAVSKLNIPRSGGVSATKTDDSTLRSICDEEFGEISLKRTSSYGRISFKADNGSVTMTVGYGVTEADVRNFLNSKRIQLRNLVESDKQRIRAPKFYSVGNTYDFFMCSVSLVNYSGRNVTAVVNENSLVIRIPNGLDCNNESLQLHIRNVVNKYLKLVAQKVLPPILQSLATRNDFKYKSVSIDNTRSRWGCCSSFKEIKLSCQILLLPEHLVHYVLLHELCHTVHMNHSQAFYSLLNKACGGNNALYRMQMKKYQPGV